MRKYLLGFVIVLATVTSCLKSKEPEPCDPTYDPCAIKAPESEIAAVKAYLTDNHITDTVRHCSGLYYKIISNGSGATPNICSLITINYKGTTTNGAVFDSTKTNIPASFVLGGLIRGWQAGIPLIKKGGSMRLFIPASLGYGSASLPGIPPGSVLIFNIDLLDVQ